PGISWKGTQGGKARIYEPMRRPAPCRTANSAGAAGAATEAAATVKLALRLTAIGTHRDALFGRSLAMSFRAIRRAERTAGSIGARRRAIVAALTVAVLRA